MAASVFFLKTVHSTLISLSSVCVVCQLLTDSTRSEFGRSTNTQMELLQCGKGGPKGKSTEDVRQTTTCKTLKFNVDLKMFWFFFFFCSASTCAPPSTAPKQHSGCCQQLHLHLAAMGETAL